MLTQPLFGRMWWGSARPLATKSSRTFFGKGISTRWSVCTCPISRLPRRYSVPPNRCGCAVIPEQVCKAPSILLLAPETGILISGGFTSQAYTQSLSRAKPFETRLSSTGSHMTLRLLKGTDKSVCPTEQTESLQTSLDLTRLDCGRRRCERLLT